MFKCENCRVQRDIGDDVYLIESSFMNTFLPTCSRECAEIIKTREVEELQSKINRIKSSGIKKEHW